MAKKTMEIFSIFHQIESVAAETMIEKHRLTKIPAEQIPPTAAFNEFDERALFAVVMPAELIPEFENLILNLRA